MRADDVRESGELWFREVFVTTNVIQNRQN
jgi:hypothetical protein